MSNTYFQFKQFKIIQVASAMKVTTDACILGALALVGGAENILDVGAGTGLLSLMVAQRSRASITALELDMEAYIECCKNFAFSPWISQLLAVNADFNAWRELNNTYWDTIICNPPFFTNHLQNQDRSARLARHTDKLCASDVIDFAARWMSDKGILCLLAPTFMKDEVIKDCSSAGLLDIHSTVIKDTIGHESKRFLLFASRNKAVRQWPPEELIIKKDTEYSPSFQSLLSPYYLHL